MVLGSGRAFPGESSHGCKSLPSGPPCTNQVIARLFRDQCSPTESAVRRLANRRLCKRAPNVYAHSVQPSAGCHSLQRRTRPFPHAGPSDFARLATTQIQPRTTLQQFATPSQARGIGSDNSPNLPNRRKLQCDVPQHLATHLADPRSVPVRRRSKHRRSLDGTDPRPPSARKSLWCPWLSGVRCQQRLCSLEA
jgi:hypothetical protein